MLATDAKLAGHADDANDPFRFRLSARSVGGYHVTATIQNFLNMTQEKSLDPKIARLKLAREKSNVKLTELAQHLGNSISTLSSLENGHYQPSGALVARIIAALKVNPDWVESGKEPMFSGAVEDRPASQIPLTEIKQMREQAELLRQVAQSNSAAADALDRHVLMVSPKPKGGTKIDLSFGSSKDILDSKKTGGSVADMSLEVPTWSQLKKQIARLTAAHGQKAALAEELGVSRQVLGNWLSDDDQGAPNAELTLWLLRWVRDPKRKTKKL